jgi:hypothetical protein
MSIREGYRRLKARDFQTVIAVLVLINVVVFIQNPAANPVHELTQPWDTLWAITYGMAGLFMVVGIARTRSAHIEAAGLFLLMAGALVQALTYLPLMGELGAVTVASSVLVLSALVWAAAARVHELFRVTRLLGGLD